MNVLRWLHRIIRNPWVVVASLVYNAVGSVVSIVLALAASGRGDTTEATVWFLNAVINAAFVVYVTWRPRKK